MLFFFSFFLFVFTKIRVKRINSYCIRGFSIRKIVNWGMCMNVYQWQSFEGESKHSTKPKANLHNVSMEIYSDDKLLRDRANMVRSSGQSPTIFQWNLCHTGSKLRRQEELFHITSVFYAPGRFLFSFFFSFMPR